MELSARLAAARKFFVHLAAKPIRLACRILPFKLSISLTNIYPPLCYFLPEGRDLVCNDFLGKFRMNVNTVYSIELDIFAGRYEREVVRIINDHVRPGMVAFDIGANVGPISFALAEKVGASGKVYPFEPGPVIYERLMRNIELNPSVRSVISPQNLGCAEKSGRMVYHELAHLRGNGALWEPDGTWVPFESHDVKITTIDEFIAGNGINRVDFIKIDVEGMEYEVLLGARETLNKFRPTLCYETLRGLSHIDSAENFRRIESILTGLGYELYQVEGNRTNKKADPENYSLNTLAMAPKSSL
jgi:FkbM family methyltransferase